MEEAIYKQALEDVRQSGITNMIDYFGVYHALELLGYYEEAEHHAQIGTKGYLKVLSNW